MPSINDDVDYNGFLPGIPSEPTKSSTIESKGRKKHKNNKKNLILRHPLNVRIDDALRKEFVATCKKTKTPQHIPLEKALRRILKSMGKDSIL